MLDDEARKDLQTIQHVAYQIWGSNCEFKEITIVNSPYPEFELPMRLFKRIEVGIYYDRSALDIGILQGDKYVLLGKFTAEQVFRGMKSMEPENLLHNFKVLDEVTREIIANSKD
jgi:hypothetical protein